MRVYIYDIEFAENVSKTSLIKLHNKRITHNF